MSLWLRHMVRQITVSDFPASWQEAQSEPRSHDSRDYDTRFMLRLDELSREQLQHLVDHFAVSKVMCQHCSGHRGPRALSVGS
jgi:hypothetical protein